MNIEESIKKLESHVFMVNATNLNTELTLAIETLIHAYKESQAKLEFKQFGDLDNARFEELYLDKQVIRDKINQLEACFDVYEGDKFSDLAEYALKQKIQVLKELLGE